MNYGMPWAEAQPLAKKRTPKGSGDVVDVGDLVHVLDEVLKGGGGEEADQLLEGQLIVASVADGEDLGADLGRSHVRRGVVGSSPVE